MFLLILLLRCFDLGTMAIDHLAADLLSPTAGSAASSSASEKETAQ